MAVAVVAAADHGLIHFVLLGHPSTFGVHCRFLLIKVFVYVARGLAPRRLIADVVRGHVLPDAPVTYLVLADVTRRVESTCCAFAGVARHAQGGLLMPHITSFA